MTPFSEDEIQFLRVNIEGARDILKDLKRELKLLPPGKRDRAEWNIKLLRGMINGIEEICGTRKKTPSEKRQSALRAQRLRLGL